MFHTAAPTNRPPRSDEGEGYLQRDLQPRGVLCRVQGGVVFSGRFARAAGSVSLLMSVFFLLFSDDLLAFSAALKLYCSSSEKAVVFHSRPSRISPLSSGRTESKSPLWGVIYYCIRDWLFGSLSKPWAAGRRSRVDFDFGHLSRNFHKTRTKTTKKVLEIRRPRQHTSSIGDQQIRKRRQTLQTVVLECAAGAGAKRREQGRGDQRKLRRPGDRQRADHPGNDSGGGVGDEDGGDDGGGGGSLSGETVLLHLWDEQTCLTSLFRKGDGLALYWPWLVQQQEQEQEQPQGVGVGVEAAMRGGDVSRLQPLSSQVRGAVEAPAERRAGRSSWGCCCGRTKSKRKRAVLRAVGLHLRQ